MDLVHSGLSGVLSESQQRWESDPSRKTGTDEQRGERRRSLDQLKDEVTRLAGHINAAHHSAARLKKPADGVRIHSG
jgi:hypothetical protein